MKGDNRIQMFPRAIDDLVENLNSTVLMILHVYISSIDDRVIIETILSKIRNEYTPKS
jgi:hypothetical protein